MTTISRINIISLVVSGGLLLLYHCYYGWHLSYGSIIQISKSRSVMSAWITKHFEVTDPANITLSIQTLRNTILVAVFIAGYCLNSSYQLLRSVDTSSDMNAEKVGDVILAICLFSSFLCWAQAIRNISHLGYIIGSWNYNSFHCEDPKSVEELKDINFPYACILAERVAIYFSFAFRFLYMSIPFSFYRLGPVSLLIATSIVVILEYIWDFGTSFSSTVSCTTLSPTNSMKETKTFVAGGISSLSTSKDIECALPSTQDTDPDKSKSL